MVGYFEEHEQQEAQSEDDEVADEGLPGQPGDRTAPSDFKDDEGEPKRLDGAGEGEDD